MSKTEKAVKGDRTASARPENVTLRKDGQPSGHYNRGKKCSICGKPMMNIFRRPPCHKHGIAITNNPGITIHNGGLYSNQ